MWKIANLLSLSRIILAIPLGLTVYYDHTATALLLVLWGGISDFLDGFLARKLNQVSELGKILDPIGDKAMIAALIIALILNNSIELWFAIVIVMRDVLIVAGGIYARSKLNYVIPSNYLGKITFNVIGFVLLFIMIDLKYSETYGVAIATIFSAASLFVYYKNGWAEIQKNKNNLSIL